MNLFFCDLCNESIPQADLDQGRAVRRGERLICSACEAAMSGGPARPEPAPTGPGTQPLPRVAATPSGSSPVVAVALAFSSVALVVAVGAGGYLFWRLEQESAALRADIKDVERAAPEHARTVSAALVAETGERENELAAAKAEITALGTRVAELERASEGNAALGRKVERIDERLSALDDLASRVEHQGGALDQLSATVTELAAAQVHAKDTHPAEPAARKPDPAPAAPGAGTPAPGAQAPGAPAWQNWLADLASPNSGTRWQAVQSLGGTGDPAVVPHLLPMLKDSDIFVRMAVCRHLGGLGSIEAIPALIDALEDEEASVREAALVALRGLSGQSIPFDPLARDGDRAKRVKAWRDWWEQSSKELLNGAKPKSKS